MREPEYSDFPLDEYLSRITRLRQALQQASIDALLVSKKENMCYFSGLLHGYYWITSWDEETQFALLPASVDKQCSLLISDGLEQATRTSWIDDVRLWNMYQPGTTQTPLTTLVAAIKDKGLHKARIAFEIGANDRPAVSIKLYEELREALPDVEFVPSYDLVSEIRSVKSNREVECVRRACQITCAGIQAGLSQLHEGMTEKELAHIICSAMMAENPEGNTAHPWSIFVHASGRSPVWFDGCPTDYRFKPGDTVYIDGGALYKGYWSDMIRCASIGTPTEDRLRFYEASRQGNEACMAMIRPGLKCSDLWACFADSCEQMGFGEEIKESLARNYSLLGHGIGLSVHEQPYLHAKSEGRLQENMTVAIEAFVPDHLPWSATRIALKSEDNVRVTSDGCELLTPLARDLWICHD